MHRRLDPFFLRVCLSLIFSLVLETPLTGSKDENLTISAGTASFSCIQHRPDIPFVRFVWFILLGF